MKKTHAQRHHERQKARQKARETSLSGEVNAIGIAYGHRLGWRTESKPIQAWPKAAARIADARAKRRIVQRGKVVTIP